MRSAYESVFEVPRRGEVTTRDLRVVYGKALRDLPWVDVLVLSADGGAPVAARVELAEVRSGWSRRPALVCPGCRAGRHLLLARGGTLRCSRCHNLRTCRQAERKCLEYNRRGGRELDELLRLLDPRWKKLTPEKMARARRLVAILLRMDRARVALLRERTRDLEAACGSM